MITSKIHAHILGEVLETEDGYYIPFSVKGHQLIEGKCETLQAAYSVLENPSDDPYADKDYSKGKKQ
jgi:hypothetical protein